MTRIDLNRIAVFVRVVEAGSFTAAAAALGLPTSSISRGVAKLEDELGVRLLNRTTRKLSLTEGGRHFFQRMQAVVTETEAAAQEVAGIAGEPRGLVRLTAPLDLGVQHLPAIIGKLRARHPGIEIELSLTSRRVDLVEAGIDLAIRGGRLDDSSLVARKIGASDLGIFAAPAYLATRGRPRALGDLVRHECLLYGGRAGRLPWRFVGPRGDEAVAPAAAVVCDDMLFLREMALAGHGLALLPAQSVAGLLAEGRLLRVLPKHAVKGGWLYLVWPSRDLVPARVVAVRELLAEELGKLF